MSATAHTGKTSASAPLWVATGVAVAILAWLLPVNLRSVSPALLRAAGEDTPSLAAFGQQLVDSEKLGSAALVLDAARSVRDPGAPALAAALDQLAARQPALVAWGGWDPYLDPIFNLRHGAADRASTPVLTLILPAPARTALHGALDGSGSIGVQAFLRLHDLTATGRFVPAHQPGGQPLDALILLTAALDQGEHLAPSLQRELRGLAETAALNHQLGGLDSFFLDLLSLSRRLNWGQLGELMRRSDSTATVDEYAHLARVAPGQLPLIYAAALFTDSADQVAAYLIHYGKNGAADLRQALADGEGAVQQLLLRQVPVNRETGPALSAAGALVLAHPQATLALKYLGYLAGFFLVLCGLGSWVISPAGRWAALGRLAPAALRPPGHAARRPPHRGHRALPAQGGARFRIPVPPPAPCPRRLHRLSRQPPSSSRHGYLHPRLDLRLRPPPGRHLPDLPAQDQGHQRPGAPPAPEAAPHGE